MLTPGELTWGEGHPSAGLRRRLRQALVASAGVHLLLASSLLVLPESLPLILPPAIDVELVAALPPAPGAPKPQTPTPIAAPAPKPKLRILPKKAPKAAVKPRVKKQPEVVRRRPKPEELSHDDALAKLRAELGEQPAVVPKPATSAKATAAASSKGSRVATQGDVWALAVMRHIRSVWIMPPEFRDLRITTRLEVAVATDGSVIGVPRVTGSSGDPYYDDNAIRAIQRSSPLPAPPKAGSYSIIFAP